MTIETSTVNVLLCAIIALLCWIVRELFKVKSKISMILTHCTKCRNNLEFDTEHLKRAA